MMTASRKRKVKKRPHDASDPRLLSPPLESLAFLLPLILFYEIGCLTLHALALGSSGNERVVAFHLLQLFFELFGSTGVWMPGVAIIIILLVTHAASDRPWSVRRRAVAWMYAESVLLALPLLVFSQLLSASPVGSAPEGSIWTDAVLGVGAGIYEELVFRLILITLLVTVGSDLLRLGTRTALWTAIVISALAFSAHHHPPLGSEPFTISTFAFRAVAGLYLGVLFAYRGYGPAAGTHAAYNLMITLSA